MISDVKILLRNKRKGEIIIIFEFLKIKLKFEAKILAIQEVLNYAE